MKKILPLLIAMQVTVFFVGTSISDPWRPPTSFQPIAREKIFKNAKEMVEFSWSPLNSIRNFVTQPDPLDYSPQASYTIYNSGTAYLGEAYCQKNAVDDWAGFYDEVNSIPPKAPNFFPEDATFFGNDCSGFVSIAWELPKRYGTGGFICDADKSTNPNCAKPYVPGVYYTHSLGGVNTSRNVELLPGDALVSTVERHMRMFEQYRIENGIKTGAIVLEQTADNRPNVSSNRTAVRHDYWNWDQLQTYRPIRRNQVNDHQHIYSHKWGSFGYNCGAFNEPSGVAVDPWGFVYVVDTGNSCIKKFDNYGNPVANWGYENTGCLYGSFIHPYAAAVDQSGNLFVAGAEDNQIHKFAPSGARLPSWGGYGQEPGLFDVPKGIAVGPGPNGLVYVADSGNHRIQVFSNGGGFLFQIINFDYPTGVAVNSSYIYVADLGNNRIYKLDTLGNYITQWGSSNPGDNELDYPVDVGIDSKGYVYVVDSGHKKIKKFDGMGDFITQWDPGFVDPIGIAVDPWGSIFVADGTDNSIFKFLSVPLFPDGPSDLRVTYKSPSRIDLQWTDNSNNETGFKIRRKEHIWGTYAQIATIPGGNTSTMTYSDTTVAPTTPYYYAVSACIDCNTGNEKESSYSKEVFTEQVSVNIKTPPAVTSGLTYTVKWEGPLNGSVKYKLEYSYDVGYWNLIADNINDTNYPWIVPALPPVFKQRQCQLRVKVIDVESGKEVGSSQSGWFRIQVVRLISPNGGENFIEGRYTDITWETNQTGYTVKLSPKLSDVY